MVKSEFVFQTKKYIKNKYKQNKSQFTLCIILTAILFGTGLFCLIFFRNKEKIILGIISLVLTPFPLVTYNFWLRLYIKNKISNKFGNNFISSFTFYNLYFTHEIIKDGISTVTEYKYEHLSVVKHKEFFALDYKDKQNKIYFEDSVFFDDITKGDELKLEKTFREQRVLIN